MAHGGGKREALGILLTKGEIKEIARRMALTEAIVQRLNEEIATFAGLAARAETALSALHSEEHKREKELLGLELQLVRFDDERARAIQKQGVVETDQRKATEEYERLESKQAEARESISNRSPTNDWTRRNAGCSKRGSRSTRWVSESAAGRPSLPP